MGQQYEKYGNMKHHGQCYKDLGVYIGIGVLYIVYIKCVSKIVSTMQKNTANLLSTHYPEQNIRVKYVPIGM